MKTYSKTFLPDEIIYKGERYTLDRIATDEHREGEKLSGKYHIKVLVLQRNLRGREDLHGKLYQPTQWIFSNELGQLRSLLPVKTVSAKYSKAYNKAMKQIKTFGY